MSNNKNKIITFKTNLESQSTEISSETLRNSFRELDSTAKIIESIKNKIKKCHTIEKLNKINLTNISNKLMNTMQNYIIITDMNYKRRLEEINNLYREVEIEYFNKKIELLSQDMEEKIIQKEQNITDITSNIAFSFISIFLGISLTSALVSGLAYIGKEYLFLYFFTCILIATVTISFAAIFLRKKDEKNIFLIVLIIIISILWFISAYLTYPKENPNQELNNINSK